MPPVLEDITVVIPTIGRALLRDCLRSVAEGSAWPSRLVVVDQGTNQDVDAWIDELKARGLMAERLRSAQTGAAAARNRGFERVVSPFIAATDDDCRVHPEWLERLVTTLRAHPGVLVTGRVDLLREQGQGGEAPSLISSEVPGLHRRPLLRRDPLFSNNMGFARELLKRLGGMDEHPSVRYAEDAEWSYRALRGGIPILYAPGVRVGHLAWRDNVQLAATYRRYAKSQGGFYGHYIRQGDWFIGLRAAYDLLRGPWLIARGTATGDSELATIGRAYVGELLPGILAGLRRG
ncbi:MAG TPA: glycosyltransferase [Gemmatimonadales bacterium]|jgi:GT2 family glycosyltransferase|nr:glycosyltransferase [Gemmatimonadales bacterium]